MKHVWFALWVAFSAPSSVGASGGDSPIVEVLRSVGTYVPLGRYEYNQVEVDGTYFDQISFLDADSPFSKILVQYEFQVVNLQGDGAPDHFAVTDIAIAEGGNAVKVGVEAKFAETTIRATFIGAEGKFIGPEGEIDRKRLESSIENYLICQPSVLSVICLPIQIDK